MEAAQSVSAPLPASLPLRVAAMIYEAVLLFGVAFVVSLIVLGTLDWTYPLPDSRRWTLQAVLFVAIGLYFVWCWARSGQTLALKTWRIQLVDQNLRAPSFARAAARYLLAWHLFVPGLVVLAIWPQSGYMTAVVLLASIVLMLAPALVDPDRRLLHDRWTATRLIRST